MAKTYKIQITKAGLSTDLFNILYDRVGDSTRIVASSPCNGSAIGITQAQLQAGYTVVVSDNATNIYITDSGGICDGRATVITL